MVVVGRYSEVVVSSGLTVLFNNVYNNKKLPFTSAFGTFCNNAQFSTIFTIET